MRRHDFRTSADTEPRTRFERGDKNYELASRLMRWDAIRGHASQRAPLSAGTLATDRDRRYLASYDDGAVRELVLS